MARDDRRRDRRDRDDRRSERPLGVKDALRSHFDGLLPEVVEVFSAQAVDATLVPEVLAARIWSVLPEGMEVSLPFVGKFDKGMLVKFAGVPIVLFLTSLLTNVAENNERFKDGIIKSFAFFDFSGGILRAAASATEGSFEGIIEGVGRATAAELIKLANMEVGARAARVTELLAKWEEWRAIARARIARLTGGSPAPSPATPASPTTATSTPATPAGGVHVMFPRWIAGELACGVTAREQRAQRVQQKYLTLQLSEPALAGRLSDPAMFGPAPLLDAENVAAIIDQADDVTPSYQDPVTGELVTPMVGLLLLQVRPAEAKAYPPPKPAAAPGTGIVQKIKDATGVDPDAFKQRGEAFHAHQKAKADVLAQRNAAPQQTPGSALWNWLKSKLS